MSQQQRAAKTAAAKTVQAVDEFITAYENLCRRFGMVVAITETEEFVVNAGASSIEMLSRQLRTMRDIPHQEW